ncbi:deoxyribodipyrimidine photo-lyase [Actinomadura sp. NEAU-AAG7]|uniref:cryptochrome/photolyase family protein n=1 Tax=Actinomadura sp. NEAU-AAG7 TaxID=2839640 RepID=UPI001BE47F62|nr:deoxyribodipyrimidine photo-lyase [Actinomadura sp. NEAU-AAG7]MBT2207918.1 DNA photolyase family protein [Actinomadura sp. NEAU-AAG7]
MSTSILLFTRDLRVRDNPALAAACRADRVVPLFVLDDAILTVPNRVRFLLESLADLRASLRAAGGDLLVRRGDPAAEVARLSREAGADALHLADERSAYGTRRLAALRELDLAVTAHPGVTVVPPGALTPANGDHYRVFTPYWRVWDAARRRPEAPEPKAVRLPDGLDAGPLPTGAELVSGPRSPDPAPGGERAGRARMRAWLRETADEYDRIHDDLAADRTSRLSAYLKFGCVSPLELERASRGGGREGFRRQLAWRDFHHQVAAAFPGLARRDYRPRRGSWNRDEDALAAWREGTTGIPIVDAGMRQLRREGFMHNRARLVTASFLTRNLNIDWREGLRHFDAWLTDGDVADNAGNWQWVAGTGNNTRPGQVMNPLRQAARFDRGGDYVRRYLPELAELDARHVHHPWTLPDDRRSALDYPPPISGYRTPGEDG